MRKVVFVPIEEQKQETDFQDEMRYVAEQELRSALDYAIKHGMSIEEADELWEDKELGFKWLYGGR